MYDLAKLNSATKYPSIPTLHEIGDRGNLAETRIEFVGEVVLTEKVDGTSSRIVLMPDGDWLIGSREELLTARGDRVPNQALGIVAALAELAHRLKGEPTDRITVFYLETFGARIGANGKQYSGTGAVGHRMFDLAYIPTHVLDWDREKIAGWRDRGGQPFAAEPVLRRAAEAEGIELTPRLGTIPASDLPTTVEETHDWLAATIPHTLAALDEQGRGQAEGIVLRTPSRSVTAKARFEDYRRTLKNRADATASHTKKAAQR